LLLKTGNTPYVNGVKTQKEVKKEMNEKTLTLLLLILTMLLTVTVLAVEPFGAIATEERTERAPMDNASNHSAFAGNVTELTIVGYTNTQSWQGYFGNVSGTITLSDASDNAMYNWSLASPEGEVYATTDTSVAWVDIACFDLSGNHSALETLFNITSDDVDGINETFSDTGTHDLFYTNNIQFSAGDCASTSIYDSTGTSVDNNFEEVLLTDSGSATQIIFTAILDQEDRAGFDGKFYDFEMLVLENGHHADTQTTLYYFYVELE
jgi:hypothetical protein